MLRPQQSYKKKLYTHNAGSNKCVGFLIRGIPFGFVKKIKTTLINFGNMLQIYY